MRLAAALGERLRCGEKGHSFALLQRVRDDDVLLRGQIAGVFSSRARIADWRLVIELSSHASPNAFMDSSDTP